MSHIEYRYEFTFPGGEKHRFEVKLDKGSLLLRGEPAAGPPDWTRLSFQQCPNCPLTEDSHPRCPVAERLVPVIEFFKDRISTEVVRLEVHTEARTYVREIPLAKGVSSLMGLFMVSSGCPILGKFKPMVRTHLPFATGPETTYRTLGMYLLAQYFRARKGLEPDWEFRGLVDIIREVGEVNSSFCQRLKAVCAEDASLNAVIRLDCFADSSSLLVQDDLLNGVAESFDAHLK